MTAADVAFTFNMLKKFPPSTCRGDWAVLSSVGQTGSDQVTMTFKAPAVPYFYYIADQTPIVPAAIWSKLANPVTYSDPHPVGTGPYMVNPCTGQNITYTANPHFWQPGLPRIKKVEYPAFTSNNTANDQLANGQAQWGSQYIPSIKAFYTSKSPDNHYWFPPTVNVSLVPNLTNPLLANVKVRQAMSYAIDRAKVSSIGESGYEPPANQSGIMVTPTFSSWLDSSLTSKYNFAFNPAKAKALLRLGRLQAGFRRHHGELEGPEARLHRDQRRRLLGLGRLDAGDPAEPQGDRHTADAQQPGGPLLQRRPVLGQVPARLLRPAVVRPGPVLRAAELARLAQHGADRQDGRQQLRALHQPGR